MKGAKYAGVETLRCIVHKADGSTEAVEIPVDNLIVDETSQFDWAYNDRRARAMADSWDPASVGALDVTPLEGGISDAEINRRKLRMDRDQRAMRQLEHFLNEVQAGLTEATEIHEVVGDRALVSEDIERLGYLRRLLT